MTAEQAYRDGWADGEQWVRDHLVAYVLMASPAGRSVLRAASAFHRRLVRVRVDLAWWAEDRLESRADRMTRRLVPPGVTHRPGR